MDNNNLDNGACYCEWNGLKVNPPVFIISAAAIFVLLAISLVALDSFKGFFDAALGFISDKTGWFFTLSANIILIFVIYLAFSRFGKIRLGGQDAKPDFSTWSWLAMLFSAGMGIGLVFWSVGEPIYHFSSPPFPVGDNQVEAARQAMYLTFFHWGLHPWGIYALIGLGLAFFSFNRGLPLTVRTVFYPLLGDKVNSWIGDIIDILAVIATLFGVATSLGLGVQQISAGLDHIAGLPNTSLLQVLLIVIITAMATISVVMGLDKGIRRLSELNMWIAGALVTLVLILGPTLFILNAFSDNIGAYIQHLPFISGWNETYENTGWQNWWTVFYWAWWIAWSPFVGMFIGRISKGRTVRQFVVGVLLVPTLLGFVWLTVFGSSAIWVEMFGGGGIVEAVKADVSVALFVFLEKFPLSVLTSVLGMIVVVTFFVTSSDSGSLVIDIITAGGHTDPPVPQRVFWAVTEGVAAAVLLYAGGLAALQTASVTTGLPFCLVLVLMCVALQKGFSEYAREYNL